MLPLPRDSFVGRSSDVARIRQRLGEGRLVTVTGAPGIGKTRVAVELGRAQQAEYARVVFVPLAAATALGPALAALGAALEVDLPPLPEAELPAAVASALATFGRTLLILDNFEQLVDSAAVLVERILSGAPATEVLVTSRRKLRLAGEWVYELGALPVQEIEGSVQLLIDRVQRLRGDYRPAPTELAQLDAIARKLEGVPLALELAAVRISTLGAASVLGHLDQPLSMLTGGVRGSETGSLRDAIARSWVLLADDERAILSACAVFKGGFDLVAASEIIPAPPGRTVLEVLHELCEKSLLVAHSKDDGTQRFHLFESIREFAAAQLDPGAKADLEGRHARYFAHIGDRLSAEGAGRDAVDALDTLAADRDNILAAAGRSLEGRAGVSAELGLRAALTIMPLALARGPIAPLVELLDRALGEMSGISERLRIAAHLAAARGHRRTGRADAARTHQTAALDLAAAHDDPRILAQIKSDLAMTLISEGGLRGALELLPDALAARQRAGDRAGAAVDRLRMGIALRELGQTEEAAAHLEAAEEVLSAAGDTPFRGLGLAELAHLALDRGLLADCRSYLDEASGGQMRSASLLTDAAVTARLGMLAHAEGDLDTAETLLQAALIGLRRVGYRRIEAGMTGYLGVIDLERDRLDQARARLKHSRLMRHEEPRAEDLFSAWVALVDVARGDLPAARRVSARIRPLDPADPLSVATHVLLAALDRSALGTQSELLARLGARATSHDVRLALRLVFARPAELAPEGPRPPSPLTVAASGRWFVTPDGERGECHRHRALRLLLLELVDQRLRRPGRAVSREELIAAGWPGEVIRSDAGRNRLKVSISSLRKVGLRELLRHDGEGYLLDDAVPVVVATE